MATRKKTPTKKPAARRPIAKTATKKKVTTTTAKRRSPSTNEVKRAPVKREVGVPTTKALPFVWKYETGVQAVGLWVDELVWPANDAGEIFVLTKDGSVERSYKLPSRV